MPTSQSAYPTQRAFVVQIHAEADVAQGKGRGRVEHIVSGQATHFATIEALVRFIEQSLASTTKNSRASEDLSDP
jgi:hypothetical protein